MNRRKALLVLLAFGATPLVSLAQQPGRVWRIGFLDLGSRQSAVDAGRFDALLNGMRELGYVYGVIGRVGPVEFYQKAVGAVVIPDSDPGIYTDLLK